MVPHTHAILKRELQCQPVIDTFHTAVAGTHSFSQGDIQQLKPKKGRNE